MSSVEHPRCHNQDYARFNLDMNYVTGGSVLAILPSNATTVERMPAVEDLYQLPDMGRMTLSLQLAETIGCSLAHCVRAGVVRPS